MSEPTILPICPYPNCPAQADRSLCHRCSAFYPNMTLFAGSRSRTLREAHTEALRSRILRNLSAKPRSVLDLQGGQLVLQDPGTGQLTLVARNGTRKLGDGVTGFFAPMDPATGQVLLRSDGTVTAQLPGDMGQGDVEGFSQIRCLAVSPRCTYGINRLGELVCAGQPLSANLQNWKNLEELSIGSRHLAARTSDGRVLVAGPAAACREAARWTGIRAITSAGEGILGLTREGRVLFAGNAGDPRGDVSQWKDIVAIAMDSSFTYGLTAQGTLRVAGSTIPSLDQGRSELVNLTQVAAIACDRSAVAALTMDGCIHIAGILRGRSELEEQALALAEGLRARLYHRQNLTM